MHTPFGRLKFARPGVKSGAGRRKLVILLCRAFVRNIYCVRKRRLIYIGKKLPKKWKNRRFPFKILLKSTGYKNTQSNIISHLSIRTGRV
ncbi:hypothetical protein [Oxalobacter paraformigenes]|uniref:hypothetical protein n=1 Tax=Oxalobacter paraformigenes TaxID=556268 RepID=UPI0005953026|nr:hypothetical protein [Oxalobacter paraformigenes]